MKENHIILQPRCAGIILLDQDRTILVKTHRGYYSFPKGKQEQGEDFLETAFREVEEETGILGTSFDLIPEFYIDEYSKKNNPSVRYYVGIMKHPVNKFTFDKEELESVNWYKFDDVFKMGPEIKPQRVEILHEVIDFLDGCLSKKEETKLSKTLTYILRHHAKESGLKLRSDGYVPVDDLLAISEMKSYRLTQLKYVVKRNDKQRFSLVYQENRWWIRANQGHSEGAGELDPELLLTLITEPEIIVHASYWENKKSIEKNGLKKMGRTMIHFSPVGQIKKMGRANATMLVHVDMTKAMSAGIKFYRADNGVILTEGFDGVVPPEFITKIGDQKI